MERHGSYTLLFPGLPIQISPMERHARGGEGYQRTTKRTRTWESTEMFPKLVKTRMGAR